MVAGILVGNPVPLGDGVDQNDKKFLTTSRTGGPRFGIRLEPLTAVRAASRADARQVVRKEKAVAAPAEEERRRRRSIPRPGRPKTSETEDDMSQRVTEGSHV